MKKVIILLIVFLNSFLGFTQDKEKTKKEKEYDVWSVELNVGQNKAIRPFAPGYFTSDPLKYFNFSDINHFDIGARYMFSNYFGLKLDFAYDNISNQSKNGSLPFDNDQFRIGLQGVANIGRILKFESFTSRLGLLGHAGIQVSRFIVNDIPGIKLDEDNGGVMIGLTPQFRITNSIVLTGDFTIINNVRQHLSWDGDYSAQDNNLSGLMYNTSLGLTFDLSNKEKHADWYVETSNNDLQNAIDENKKKLDEIESKLQDTDRDGVPDYLDKESNTPSGVAVNTKGQFIDTNNNGIADELEPKDGKDGLNTSLVSKEDAIKVLIEKGYVNVFYDLNKDQPNSGSTNNVYYIIKFLKEYPTAKAKFVGYADVRGNEEGNKDLSERRAKNLLNIAVDSGVESSRLEILGNGVDTSFPSNTSIGLDLARRVTIILE